LQNHKLALEIICATSRRQPIGGTLANERKHGSIGRYGQWQELRDHPLLTQLNSDAIPSYRHTDTVLVEGALAELDERT